MNVIFRPRASVKVFAGSTRSTDFPSVQVWFGVGFVTVIHGFGEPDPNTCAGYLWVGASPSSLHFARKDRGVRQINPKISCSSYDRNRNDLAAPDEISLSRIIRWPGHARWRRDDGCVLSALRSVPVLPRALVPRGSPP